MTVSVLLPSRGRPEQLESCVRNLLGKAERPGDVEILVALDPDDTESAKVFSAWPRQTVAAWTSPERYGYARLHEYVNFLAGEASADWLMLWNDDAVMVTDGWDVVIGRQPLDACLFMDAVYPCAGERGNIFPVWPRAWSLVTGYVSLSPNCDVWVSDVARRLGRERRIAVRAVHERRHDEDADATHAEGRAAMGEGNDRLFNSAANRLARTACVRVIGSLYGPPIGS